MLNRGRLVPPASVDTGRKRLHTLIEEIAGIERQLADRDRAPRYVLDAEYYTWRKSATAAKLLFESELRQLQAWLATAEHPLLREAHALLVRLREEDVEFDAPELELIAKLDRHFKE
jgi:hypothetical protein